MNNNPTKNSSKLSAIKFIKGIKPKIKKSKVAADNDGLMYFLRPA